MNIVDKNGRLFKKISILDILVVLVLLITIVSFAFSKIKPSENTTIVTPVSNESVGFTTVIKFYSLPATEKSPFDNCKNIYNSDGSLIGEIKSVRQEKTLSKIRLLSGEYVEVQLEDYVDYFVTIEGKGTQNEKGIFASGTVAIIPNNNLVMTTKTFAGNGIVLSVEKAK